MFRANSSFLTCILIAVGPTLTPSAMADQAAGPLRISGPVSVEIDTARSESPDLVDEGVLLPFPAFGHGSTASFSPASIIEGDAESSGISEQTPVEVDPAPDNGEVPATEPVSAEPFVAAESASEVEAVQIPERAEQEFLPLGKSAATARSEPDAPALKNSGMAGIARTAGATALVIGLILILRFVFVKVSGATGGLRAQLGPSGKAPSGVLLVLGRYPVSRGMSLVLLQLDQRVLLLSQTGSGFSTLAELTDPDEVSSIIRKARDENGESLSAKFTGMLKKFESDPDTIEDLDSSTEARPVRLRIDSHEEQFRASEQVAPQQGYLEAKPSRSVSTGEDELRSRINRLREYGA